MLKNNILISILIVFSLSCLGQTRKINGLSFVASSEPLNRTHISPVINIKANYVSIMPFGFIRDLIDSEIIYNSDRQWFGETTKGARQYISELKKNNIKIMLKPQIWVWRGEYTGSIKMLNEKDWEILENSYSKFILEYVHLAQDLKVDMFCMGTELEQFVVNRPKFWECLIAKIRTLYKGKLTYASNWNEFTKITFWDKLDYIGIDAYFPISTEKTPSVAGCIKGWEKYKEVIRAQQKQYNKPILFTEFGYRSVDFAGKKPWNFGRDLIGVNLTAQTNATEALFKAFWNEDWFAGGFVWKWFHNYKIAGGKDDSHFTPQNKPVEKVIKDYFSR